MQITPEKVEFIFDYIEDLCSIVLDEPKRLCVEAGLSPLVKQPAIKSPTEWIERGMQPSGEAIRMPLVEAMTTRETFCFRENSPFEALQCKALPELLDIKIRENDRKLRVWSASDSTGQEACSIGIAISEMIPDLHRWDIQILATDISEVALAKARSGIYTKMDVERGLPKFCVSKYFSTANDGYKINDSIHRLIEFQQRDLLSPFQFPQLFDLVFCRNIAIDYEKKAKIDLFRRMLKWMPAHGMLFVGASESLLDCGPEFRPQHPRDSTFYQPNLQALPSGTTPGLPSMVTSPAMSGAPTESPVSPPTPNPTP